MSMSPVMPRYGPCSCDVCQSADPAVDDATPASNPAPRECYILHGSWRVSMADDSTSMDRRGFFKRAATGAAAAAIPGDMHAQEHDHDHQVVPSDPALRTKALESLLVEKGLVDPAALDAIVDMYENKIGPRNGARVVAHAWVDPDYKKRLLA